MNTVQKALAVAANRLRVFKKAAQDARECDWTLDPSEFWEPEDDAALDLLETAMAQQRGERPLFPTADLDQRDRFPAAM